jgi:hypothetical protein
MRTPGGEGAVAEKTGGGGVFEHQKWTLMGYGWG